MSDILTNMVALNRNKSYYIAVPPTAENIPRSDSSASPQKRRGNAAYLSAGLAGLAAIGISIACKRKVKPNSARTQNAPVQPQIQPVVSDGSDFVSGLVSAKNNASAYIRSSLAKLLPDTEWRELRMFRKGLLKDINGKDLYKHDIALKKIPFVNDLLVLKVHPEEYDTFLARNLISPQDAKDLIKKEFVSVSEFDREYQKLIKYDFDYCDMSKFFVSNNRLYLSDFFREEVETYRDFTNKINLMKVPA